MGESRTVDRDRRIHLLLIAYFCDPTRGSEPGIAWNWIQHLSEFCRLTVITRQANKVPIETHLAARQLPGTSFHYVDAPPGFRSWSTGKLHYPRWQQRAATMASRLHRQEPFDLAHQLTVASINYPSFLRLPVPLVVGPVGGGEIWPESFRSKAGKKAALYERLRGIRQRTLKFDPFTRVLLRRCALLLVATPETQRFLADFAPCPLIVMPMAGVEPEMVAPERDVEPDVGCRVYTAGRLIGWKGLDLALAAFAKVSAKHPAASFTIYGDGPDRAALEQLAGELGIAARVRFAGWLPRDELIRQSQGDDLFLFPSLRDSGGVAVLEAMAAGNPVICLDAGGPAVMVTPGCGILTPVTNPEQTTDELAQALDQLIAAPLLRAEFGRAARRRVLDEFVWERKAGRLNRLYNGLLDSQRTTTSTTGV